MKKMTKENKKKLAIGGGMLVSVLLVTGVGLALLTGEKPSVNPVNDEAPAETEVFRHPLTGEVVDAALEKLPQVFGVMVENSADAWPLSGVNEAFLVIEAPAEGNIPRFITFFSDEQTVEKIGPVRSARPYYLDWNAEFDAVYAHVGGSPEALDLIQDYGTQDLNEFYQGEYFYRWNQRYAPHNAYTTTESLKEGAQELQPETPVYETWTFKDDQPTTEYAPSICVDWPSSTTYDFCWYYQAETNEYVREQGGITYTANNVAIMATEITIIDATGRKHIVTTGKGDALILQDGVMTLGEWEKEDRTSRLRFYDGNEEFAMNAGKTWVEVVSSLGSVSTVPKEE